MNIFPKRGDVVSLFKSVSTLRFGMIKLNPYSKKSDFLVKQDLPNRKMVAGWTSMEGWWRWGWWWWWWWWWWWRPYLLPGAITRFFEVVGVHLSRVLSFTPGKINGWNLRFSTPGKGETSSKPSFSGSMLILGGVILICHFGTRIDHPP